MTPDEKQQLRERYKSWMRDAIKDGIPALQADRTWRKYRALVERNQSQPNSEACFLNKELA